MKDSIINYLALLGWNPGTDQELFTLDELVENFNLEQVQKGGAIFNEEKLKWFNREYLKKLDHEIIKKEISKNIADVSEERISRMASSVIDRISTLNEISVLDQAGEFDYAKENLQELDKEKILWHKSGKAEQDPAEAIKHLTYISEALETLSTEDFSAEKIKEKIWEYATAEGKGNVLWPFRYSLSGKDKSPDPFELAYILGKETTLKRLHDACKILES